MPPAFTLAKQPTSKLLLVVVLFAWAVPPSAGASSSLADRVLSDAEWRADLQQVVESVLEIHPDPFRAADEEAFSGAAARLREEIPELDDQHIVIRLAELVALLEDGHTRVFLPRQHHELAPELELGHSGTDPPAHRSLELGQLPVRFGLFSDGLFVTHATAPYGDLVGQRVERFGEVAVEEALQLAESTIAAGNASRRRFLVPDRLGLAEVLVAAGLADTRDSVGVRLVDPAGAQRTVILKTLDRIEIEWMGGPRSLPLSNRHPDTKAWFELLAESSTMYVRVDELEAFPERPWAEFVARTLEAAEAARAERYVLDLRANAGGNGSWVTPFVTGLGASRHNRYGRLLVLIGGSTFSAAQTLVNQLERYTDVCFVGEPSGAPPTHFGDSRKVVLENSGLTLRVSSLYWPNWLAGEFRQATNAHVDAAPSSANYFEGRDAVLDAALTYEPPLGAAAQVEDLLRREKTQAGILHFMRYLSDPRVEKAEAASFVDVGHRLLDDGLHRAGRIVFIIAGDYLPASADAQAGWGRAMELNDDPEAAARHYERALGLDPANELARLSLDRLRLEE